MEEKTDLPVKCIAKAPWRGVLYEMRIPFEPGETKMLPAALARKYVTHHDVFVAGDVEEAPKLTKAEKDAEIIKAETDRQKNEEEERERVLDFKSDIDLKMNKEALKEVAARYNIKLDGRKPIEQMRAEVKQLVDQFGIY